ncbi:MAG TPA: hypothetical protein VF039_06930 [Longimicrobiales bacterium]
MNAFEYLSVLVSIVLGLGITQLLTGFGRWLEQRDTFRAYAPAIAWAAFLLLVHVQTWWTMFGMDEYESWNFLQFTTVLLQPILLFLLAVIVFPGPHARSSDLRQNFHAQRRWFFGLLIAVLAASLLKDAARGELPEPMNLLFHAVFMVQAVLGIVSAGERLQRYLAYSSLAIFSVYIALLFAELG